MKADREFMVGEGVVLHNNHCYTALLGRTKYEK